MGAPRNESRTPADGASLSRALEGLLERLPALGLSPEPKDGILFSGNRHDAIPRRLYLDKRLTPLERNCWALVRCQLRDEGVSVMPTYEELRPYLATTPCAARASEETVARALTILRLTRWLSLVRDQRRDPATGRFQGNLYVLHDEPLTLYEAMRLDPGYLELVGRSLTHASKAVEATGRHTLREISEDPELTGRSLPSRLQVLIERLSSSGGADEETIRDATGDAEPDGPQRSHLAGVGEARYPQEHSAVGNSCPSSDSEDGASAVNGALRIPKPASTVRTVHTDLIDKEIRTVPRAREDLRLPEGLANLRPEQREGTLAALRQVEADLQQLVLDEWAARCQTSTVRNPAAYLFGLIQRALRGEFRAWAGSRSRDPATSESSADANPAPVAPPSRRDAQSHVAALKRRMRMP